MLSLNELPVESLHNIFLYCEYNDIISYRNVNSKSKELFKDKYFWNKKYELEYFKLTYNKNVIDFYKNLSYVYYINIDDSIVDDINIISSCKNIPLLIQKYILINDNIGELLLIIDEYNILYIFEISRVIQSNMLANMSIKVEKFINTNLKVRDISYNYGILSLIDIDGNLYNMSKVNTKYIMNIFMDKNKISEYMKKIIDIKFLSIVEININNIIAIDESNIKHTINNIIVSDKSNIKSKIKYNIIDNEDIKCILNKYKAKNISILGSQDDIETIIFTSEIKMIINN